jgi:hypothetical protein
MNFRRDSISSNPVSGQRPDCRYGSYQAVTGIKIASVAKTAQTASYISVETL